MAKKLIVIMIFLCAVFTCVIVYTRQQTDGEGPEIVADDSDLTLYREDMTEPELLEGMSAIDEKEGDVSDKLTVESVYNVDDSTVVVSYAAKDTDNNVTKFKRTLKAEPEDEEDDPEEETEETSSDSAESSEDSTGDEKDDNSENVSMTPTQTPAEDEAEVLKEEQEAEAEAMPSQNPRIFLTDYLVTLSVGATWNPLDYVSEITDDADDTFALWRKIQVADEVNTSAAGTYECTYYVIDSQGNISNNATIRVVVE